MKVRPIMEIDIPCSQNMECLALEEKVSSSAQSDYFFLDSITSDKTFLPSSASFVPIFDSMTERTFFN